MFSTNLDCSVVCTQALSLKIRIIGDWRRRSSRKATKSHLQTVLEFLRFIPDFSPKHNGFISKILEKIRILLQDFEYRILDQRKVCLDVILRMSLLSSRIFLRVYHIFLQKSSNHLYCAEPQPHVPAAYVGRPGRPADLEEPL